MVVMSDNSGFTTLVPALKTNGARGLSLSGFVMGVGSLVMMMMMIGEKERQGALLINKR